MQEKRRVLIVINPKAGRSSYDEALQYIEHEFEVFGIESERFFTALEGRGLLSQRLKHQGFDEVLVLGGDGTLNYVVNEIQGIRLPISVVGTGTGNDSVRSLHGVTQFEKQVELALHGETRAYDLGLCNGRYFVNGLGLGFDGQVVLEMERRQGKRGSRLDYLRTVLRILYGFKEKEVIFSMDGISHKRKVLLLTVSNGSTFGGGFVVNPFARADDGLLDICILGELAPLKRFWHLPKLIRGSHTNLDVASFHQAKRIDIRPTKELVAHLDGELLGHPPFRIEVVQRALLVRSPRQEGVRRKK